MIHVKNIYVEKILSCVSINNKLGQMTNGPSAITLRNPTKI